jgi:hypothetical protein
VVNCTKQSDIQFTVIREKYKGENPVVIRVDVNSGHGARNLKKVLETTADIYSFIFYNMKLTPEFSGLNYQKARKKLSKIRMFFAAPCSVAKAMAQATEAMQRPVRRACDQKAIIINS